MDTQEHIDKYLGCCFSHIKDRDFSCEGKAVVIHVMLEGNSPMTFPIRGKKKFIKCHLLKLIHFSYKLQQKSSFALRKTKNLLSFAGCWYPHNIIKILTGFFTLL